MTSRLTSDELAVIEAAVRLCDLRGLQENGHRINSEATARALVALSHAVANLHAEHDGRWSP